MTEYEWCIMDRRGYMHRGPMSKRDALTWLDEWVEMSPPNDLFYVARRPVGEWEKYDGLDLS